MVKLPDSKAECSCEHHTITSTRELRDTTERNIQNHEMQVAKLDAMGYRIAEITDLLAQRESRMETEMRDMCTKIQTMHATLQKTKPTVEHPGGTFDKQFRDTEAAINRAYNATLKFKGSGVPKPKVQIGSTQLPMQQSTVISGIRASPITRLDMPSTSNTRDVGLNPMSLGTSATEVTPHPLNRPSPGTTTNGGTTTKLSARAYTDGTRSAFQTAEGTVPTGRPCACSIQKQEMITIDSTNAINDSTKSTRGSSVEPSPAAEEDEPISPEQPKFTEAISKAMSKELKPLIGNPDKACTRPTIYKGTRIGLSMVGFL